VEQFDSRNFHDSQSPETFHKWLTAEEFGRNYGLAESRHPHHHRLARISRVSRSGSVYPNGMVIDFSGTAGQVAEGVFTRPFHSLKVKWARNTMPTWSDPQIPEVLAPAVQGVVVAPTNLQGPHKMARAAPRYTYTYNRQQYQSVVSRPIWRRSTT